VGFFDRFKRKEKPPDAASSVSEPAANGSTTTTAERPDFTLSMPFRWEAVPCDEGHEFRNLNLPEKIIVTVLQHNRELAADELEDAITPLVTVRRNAVRQPSVGAVVLSETTVTRANEQVEARVTGEDAANKVRLAFVIRGTPRKTVTVALTRYMLDEVGASFADYAGIIFDLLKIKNG
jgi:hypothetical protein